MSIVAEIKGEKICLTVEIPLKCCRCCLCDSIVSDPMWVSNIGVNMACDRCHSDMEKAGDSWNHMPEMTLAPLIENCALAGRGCDTRVLRGAEHKCDFRDVKCAIVRAEGAADRCGMLFAPGDFGAHLAAEHGYTLTESFEFTDGAKIVCESKMTPGMFAMARFDADKIYVALIDTRVRDAACASVIIRDSSGGTAVGKMKISYVRSGHYVGATVAPKKDGVKIISVHVNEYFGDFAVGDVWEVNVDRFGCTQSMRVGRVDMVGRYVVLRVERCVADDRSFRVPFDAPALIRRIARGERKMPAAEVDEMAVKILEAMSAEDMVRVWAARVGQDAMMDQIRAFHATDNPCLPALMDTIERAMPIQFGPTEEEQIAMALAASMETAR